MGRHAYDNFAKADAYDRAWRSGKRYAALYKHLLDEGEGLFTRSAGGGRVVETGSYWLQVGCVELNPNTNSISMESSN